MSATDTIVSGPGLGDYARGHELDLALSPTTVAEEETTYRRVVTNKQVDAVYVSSPRPADRRIVLLNQLGRSYERVAIDIYRYETNRATRTDASRELPRDIPDAGPDLAALDTALRVRSAVASLPTKLAEVVRLQHLDGLSQAEISEKLGIPVGTVKSRSHHAYRLLVTRLANFR